MRFLEILTAIVGVAMSFGYYPQAYKIWRSKQAADISIPSYVMFAVGTVIWTIYGLVQMDWTIVSSFVFGAVGSWMVLILAYVYQRRELVTALPPTTASSVVMPSASVEAKTPASLDGVANFLYEVGILAKTPRSGFHFLGGGQQSVAEHTQRAAYVGFALGMIAGDVDTSKVMQMCLMHDLAEGRTSDLNYVHQKYVKVDEHKAIQEIASSVSFGHKISELLTEYEARATKESLLANDADQLELLLSLREISDTGNTKAETWIPNLMGRLKTLEAKALAERILNTPSDAWWFGEKQDVWWVSRDRKKE